MKKISFSSFIVLFVSMLFLTSSFAQDTPQWGLPDGVKARIGKGVAKDVAVSPDGTQLAIATGIGVWLYDAQTGDEIALLTGHTRRVRSVAYSPNGKTLASGSSSEIRLWDPSTQAHKTTFMDQQASSLAYSPDGRTLAAGRWQGIDLLNVQTGERKSSLSGHTEDVRVLAFSSDGKKLASAADHHEDATIFLWNARTGKHLRTLTGHPRNVHSLTFSPDNSTLASGSRDDIIRLWNAKTGKQTRTIEEWSDSLTYFPDGKTIGVGQGGTIVLLNANTGDVSQGLPAHKDGIHSLIFSLDGSTAVSSSWDGTTRVWNVETLSFITIEGHFNFERIALSPNGKTVAVVNAANIFLYNALNGQFDKVLDVGRRGGPLTYSPDGGTLAIETWEDGRQIHLLNARTGKSKRSLDWEGDGVRAIAFSPDGKILASGSWGDGIIRVWNAKNGKLQHKLSGHTESVETLVFSSDGKTLASGGGDRTIRLWNPKTGQLQRTLEGHRHEVRSLAFSPNGNTLASGNWDELHLWNPRNGQLKQTIEGARGEALAFSKDGQTLAAGRYRVIHLLNARTGEIQRALSGPPEAPSYLAFTPDGGTLVSGGYDRTILLWDMNGLPKPIPEDINLDGVVNMYDLMDVVRYFGQSVGDDIHPNPDVTGDGVVDRQDVLRVITLLEAAAGSPPVSSQTPGMLTVERLQRWINNAKQFGNTDEPFQRGIRVLEELLATLATETKAAPVETALLPNYPNPFNPETWIPYQLAKPANVTITIYDAKGSVVRTLVLGHQPEGYYTEQQRAAYWDGRNTLGERVASGVYFYQLHADAVSLTRKMVILK